MPLKPLNSLVLSAAVIVSSMSLSLQVQAETLSEALVSVYNKNPQLLAARARLREVDESYVQARAQGRFTADITGQYSRTALSGTGELIQFGPGPVTGDAADLDFFYAPRSGQVQIIQPLYQGGRVKALKAQAKSGILAQREILRATENQLFLAASTAYVDVQLAEEAARIRRNNVRVLTQQLTAAKERFEVGQGTRTDIAQSETRVALAEAGLAQADADLQSARASYQRLVGRPPVDLQTVPAFAMPQSLAQAKAYARENNPELIASYFSEEAGKAAIDVAKAAGRPTFSLNGSLGEQQGELFSFDRARSAALTAQIRIPIFSGGLNSSRVRQAKHAKTRLAFESRDRELAVDQAISQIWAQRDSAQRALRASQQQVRSAEIAFEGVTLEQEVGTRTQLDVLDAEQELLNAKLSVINAQRNLNLASFQLLATMGVFDSQVIQLSVEKRYDPSENFDSIRYDGLTKLIDKTIASPVQNIADKGSELGSEIVSQIGSALTSEPVKTIVKLPAEAVITGFSEGKTLIDGGEQGNETETRDLNIAPREIETDPLQTDGKRDLPPL